MKEALAKLIAGATAGQDKRLLVREYLQIRVLGLLQEQGAFRRAAFHGGTALRLLFGLPRFSEDLELSTTRPHPDFPLEQMAGRTARRLAGEGYDRASLLAGKLHAVLVRRFTKGRDLYDLLWHLADPQWPPPNLELLNNALAQTSWAGPRVDNAGWRGIVAARLEEIDWNAAVQDVRPFLERPPEASLLTREHPVSLLKP